MNDAEEQPEVELITSAQLLRRVRMTTFDVARFCRKVIAVKASKAVTCTSGCAWCCYAKILTDGAQGAFIAMYLMQVGRWTPALQERLRAAAEAMTPTEHGAWLEQRRPCVFLKVTAPGKGECTVYPVRPVACAMTFSVEGDPAACAEVGGQALTTVGLDQDYMRGLLQDHQALLRTGGETRHWLMTLPAAVLYGGSLVEAIGTDDPERRADVFRLAKEDGPKEGIDAWFDAEAARRQR